MKARNPTQDLTNKNPNQNYDEMKSASFPPFNLGQYLTLFWKHLTYFLELEINFSLIACIQAIFECFATAQKKNILRMNSEFFWLKIEYDLLIVPNLFLETISKQ